MDYTRFARENSILVDVRDGVALVTLNRPDRMNSVTDALHTGLEDVLATLNRDADARAVVITGAGDKAFCAGADLKDMAARAEEGDIWPPGFAMRAGKWLVQNFLNLEAPIIGAINGHAAGLGCTIALMCDITIMADNARIGDSHVQVGLVAGDGGPLILPFLIGMNRAKEMLLTGRMLAAAEAGEIGLVNRVVPQAQVLPQALALAKELAQGAPLAIKWTKAALNQRIWQEMAASHHFSLAVESLTMNSGDNKEAARAFAAKRKPVFRGH